MGSRTVSGTMTSLGLGLLLFSSCSEDGGTPPLGRGGPWLSQEVLWKVPSAPSSNDFPHFPAANAERTSVYFPTTPVDVRRPRFRRDRLPEPAER